MRREKTSFIGILVYSVITAAAAVCCLTSSTHGVLIVQIESQGLNE